MVNVAPRSNKRAFLAWERELFDAASRFDAKAVVKDAEKGCWVYGAGGFGRSVAAALARGGYPILGFIDRSARDKPHIGDHCCIHPDDLNPSDVAGRTYVHGLMNHTFPSHDVAQWASEFPFSRLLFPADILQLPHIELANYWLATWQTLFSHIRDIEVVHDALADVASADVYRGVLTYRVSTDPRVHPKVSADDQYVPDFLPIFNKAISFVDGGAYTGDTLESLLAHHVNVRDWLAFEPDERNFDKLIATAKAHRNDLERYTIIPCGLGEKNGEVVFATDGVASRILSNNAVQPVTVCMHNQVPIKVLRLDDILWRRENLYIKMDIEGAELSALRGMVKLLVNQGPIVAVSIYHQPADIWDIPLFFLRTFDKPKLYVRQHGHHGFDTVLYVIP